MGSLLTGPVMRQSAVKNVFIRGSVVRYVHLPANAVDVPLLEDATRRGTFPGQPVGITGWSIFHLCCSWRLTACRGGEPGWKGKMSEG
jgi:hypothetical protein